MATWNLFVLYNNKETNYNRWSFLIFESFTINRKPPPFAHFVEHEKKPSDVIHCLYEMQLFYWLLCVAKSCDWSRKITPLSNVTFPGMKTYSKSRIELQNLQIFYKVLEKSNQFCHQSSPVSRKSWTLPWKLQELKKYVRKTCGCGQPGGHSIRDLNERSISDHGNLCPLWLVILKSVWNIVRDFFKLRYSWPWAVARYTFLATVPGNGLEHSHQSVCQQYILRLRKVEVFK